uniref:Gustatory receptor n=1 Tax=Lutzomyia longipalpis TaxID=7200 RepID=A0A1B0CM60_LUTLO
MVRYRESKVKNQEVKVIEVCPAHPGGDSNSPRKDLENSLRTLFYISKLFGLFPFDFCAFYRLKEFKVSIISSIWSLFFVFITTVELHRHSWETTIYVKENYPSLTFAVYVAIVYSEPLIMIILVVANICNQKHMISVIQHLHNIEEKLILEGRKIHYSLLKWKIPILIFIFVGGELVLMIFYIFLDLQDEDSNSVPVIHVVITWIWLFLPLILTTLTRTWFVTLMNITELFFIVLNDILRATVNSLEEQNDFPARKWTKKAIFDENLGHKLIRLCHLHAEIGRISLQINRIFHLENFLSMLFNILLIVTHMFFIYLSALNQQVPPLFRSTDNMGIAIFYVLFCLWKVFYIIWVASQVKRQAQLTGSYLHQIAVAVDEVPCYRLINRLSVQIWQQRLEFPVRGFFVLDMSTIGTYSGAILMYVVILIQFNLAGGSLE